MVWLLRYHVRPELFLFNYIMATFTGNIQTGNGYKFQTVEVCGITSYSTAVQVLEARYPGAKITAVRMTSNRD